MKDVGIVVKGQMQLRKRLKHTRTFVAWDRELQSACSNLEPPERPKGRSWSFLEVHDVERLPGPKFSGVCDRGNASNS